MASVEYQWKLNAKNNNGTLSLEWSTGAKFIAKKAKVCVYNSRAGFPNNPNKKKKKSHKLEKNNNTWDTGLKYVAGMTCAYIAENPFGDYVYINQVTTK